MVSFCLFVGLGCIDGRVGGGGICGAEVWCEKRSCLCLNVTYLILYFPGQMLLPLFEHLGGISEPCDGGSGIGSLRCG